MRIKKCIHIILVVLSIMLPATGIDKRRNYTTGKIFFFVIMHCKNNKTVHQKFSIFIIFTNLKKNTMTKTKNLISLKSRKSCKLKQMI